MKFRALIIETSAMREFMSMLKNSSHIYIYLFISNIFFRCYPQLIKILQTLCDEVNSQESLFYYL